MFLKAAIVLVFLFCPTWAIGSASAADVRNSNWGDTSEVVRRNQEEITKEVVKDARVKELKGTVSINDKPFEITYAFFDDKLVRVRLSADYIREHADKSNRQANWNPFNEALGLEVLLQDKYGHPAERIFRRDSEPAGWRDAQEWVSRMPRDANLSSRWEKDETSLELFCMSKVNPKMDARICSLTYGVRGGGMANLEDYENRLRDKENEQRIRNAAKDL